MTPEVTEDSLQAELTGFSRQQKADALALVLAGEVEPVNGLAGVYKVKASNGTDWYWGSRYDCSCRSKVPCKHQAAIRMYEARELMRKAAWPMASPDRPRRRHPAIVTADRLLDATAAWGEHLTGEELRAVSTAQEALRRVGEAERDRPRLTPAESVAIATERRSAAVADRDVDLAVKALAVLGDRCPEGRRRVAEARIAEPGASWTEIAVRLGLKPNAATMSFRRLCEQAGLR